MKEASTSFFEKNEAKKLLFIGALCAAAPCSADRSAAVSSGQEEKVFLLLFVHKKKNPCLPWLF
jgi:hypothetical protein